MTVDQQHTKSFGRWVAGFIAVLVVGLLGSTAFGSLAHAAGTTGGDSPAVKAQVDPGLHAAILALNAKARENWPNEFGEVWIKRDGPDAGVYVAFTEGAEAKVAELVAELDFPQPDLLVPVTVKYSSKEMQQRLMIVVGDREAAKMGLPPLGHVTDGLYDLVGDVKNSEIVVRIPVFTSEFKAAFVEAYGDDLRFTEQELAVPVPGVKARLKKVNRKLRQTTKRFKQAKVKYRTFKRRSTVQRTAVKRSYRQALRLKRRVVKQRQQKRKLVRKIRRTAVGSLAHAAGTTGGDSPAVKAQSDRELRSAIGTLTGEAHVTWPDTFGWVWLKPADNPRKPGDPEEGIFVGFSEGAEAKVAELAEDFIRPDLLVAVTVKHSMKEIDEILHRIGIDRDRAKQGLPPLGQVFQRGFDLDSDIPNGKIIVAMPNITKKIKNAFRKEYGPDGIRFKFIDRGLSGLAAAEVRLKKVNRKLRQTTKRFKRAKVKYRTFKRRSTVQGTAVKRSYRQARRLKRQVVKQRQQKRKLVRRVRRLT